MKLKLIIVICLLAAICCSADTIVMKDGTTRTVYNVEEAGNWILYTETAQTDSELRRIAAKDVFAIKKDDGQMQAVGGGDAVQSQNGKQSVQTDVPTPGAPRFVASQPHPQNDSIIALYNSSSVQINKPIKNKIHSGNTCSLWGLGKESVIMDNNITIAFESHYKELFGAYSFGYKISVYNGGDKTVYVDLTNSFRVERGTATPFFDGSTYSQNTGSTSGGSFNLGALAGAFGVGGVLGTLASGVSVGGASNSGVSVSQAANPILTIPPKAKAYLPLRKVVDDREIYEILELFQYINKEVSWFDDHRDYYLYKRHNEIKLDSSQLSAESIKLYKNSVVSFSEDRSPKVYEYRISYSTCPDFAEYTTLPVNVYLKDLVGDGNLSLEDIIMNNQFINCISFLRKK